MHATSRSTFRDSAVLKGLDLTCLGTTSALGLARTMGSFIHLADTISSPADVYGSRFVSSALLTPISALLTEGAVYACYHRVHTPAAAPLSRQRVASLLFCAQALAIGTLALAYCDYQIKDQTTADAPMKIHRVRTLNAILSIWMACLNVAYCGVWTRLSSVFIEEVRPGDETDDHIA